MDSLKNIFKKDYIVGLDIGSSSIKLVQFLKKEEGPRLLMARVAEIAPADRKSEERERTLAPYLKRLLKGVDTKRSRFHMSVNCPRTSAKKMTAPLMPKEELAEGIRLQAKEYFPFPVDDAVFDFAITGNVIEKGIRKFQLIAATSPRKTIDENVSILKAANLKPSLIVPQCLALEKVVEIWNPGEEKAMAVVDIGERFTELIVSKAGKMVFSRKLPVSGGDFTKAMTGTLVSDRGKTELSLEDAENIKRRVGIPPDGQSQIIDEKVSTTQVASMLRSPLEQLASEISRSLYYYREESGGETIDSLVLFGGGSSLKGLDKFLSDEVGIEVRYGNPIEKPKMDPRASVTDGPYHQFASAIGAALASERGVNLVPPELKEETQRTVKRASLTGIATAVVLIPIFLYAGMRIQLANYQKNISAAEAEIVILRPQYEKAQAMNLSNMLLAEEPYWEEVFKELSNVIPPSVHLTELSMENKAFKMKGVVTSEDEEGLLSRLMTDLKNGIFRNVKLVSVRDSGKEGTSFFEMEFRLD